MKPGEALRTMRARGYTLTLEDGRLAVRAPANGLEADRKTRAVDYIRAHQTELRALVTAEHHPAVAAALNVLPGARLREVRPQQTPICEECGKPCRIAVTSESLDGERLFTLCARCDQGGDL